MDLVIIQDLFLTETAREFGTVFLPACSSYEKDGTFMNGERRIQRVRAAVRPAGASKPDWQIVAGIAHEMGRPGFAFGSAEEIWDEVRAVAPGARGMTYARLDAGGLQWPCPDLDHAGTTILHAGSFAHGHKASLAPIEYRPTSEQVSDTYPFMLVTGRSLYHFNAGTMTNRTLNLELRPSDTLDISSADAATSGLRDGDAVRVVSAHGETVLPVRVTDVVPPGQLFATFQTPAFAVNAVTSSLRDGKTGTPEYKVTAVRIEKMAESVKQSWNSI
jgi:formate dehydrogenase major subunit